MGHRVRGSPGDPAGGKRRTGAQVLGLRPKPAPLSDHVITCGSRALGFPPGRGRPSLQPSPAAAARPDRGALRALCRSAAGPASRLGRIGTGDPASPAPAPPPSAPPTPPALSPPPRPSPPPQEVGGGSRLPFQKGAWESAQGASVASAQLCCPSCGARQPSRGYWPGASSAEWRFVTASDPVPWSELAPRVVASCPGVRCPGVSCGPGPRCLAWLCRGQGKGGQGGGGRCLHCSDQGAGGQGLPPGEGVGPRTCGEASRPLGWVQALHM